MAAVRVDEIADNDVVVYLDGINGADNHLGSQLQPVKTLDRALDLIPTGWRQEATIIDVAGTTYDISDGNREWNRLGPVGPDAKPLRFQGAQPTVLASGTATSSTIVGGHMTKLTDTALPALATDVYRHEFVRMTSGSAAGRRACLRGNTVDTIDFGNGLPGATDGDSYQVETPSTIIKYRTIRLDIRSGGRGSVVFHNINFQNGRAGRFCFFTVNNGTNIAAAACKWDGLGPAGTGMGWSLNNHCTWEGSVDSSLFPDDIDFFESFAGNSIIGGGSSTSFSVGSGSRVRSQSTPLVMTDMNSVGHVEASRISSLRVRYIARQGAPVSFGGYNRLSGKMNEAAGAANFMIVAEDSSDVKTNRLTMDAADGSTGGLNFERNSTGDLRRLTGTVVGAFGAALRHGSEVRFRNSSVVGATAEIRIGADATGTTQATLPKSDVGEAIPEFCHAYINP